jgi:hypothetical protein
MKVGGGMGEWIKSVLLADDKAYVMASRDTDLQEFMNINCACMTQDKGMKITLKKITVMFILRKTPGK